MKCRTVKDTMGREFNLTEDEEKFVRAIERLERLDSGRIVLFANGSLSLRFDSEWHDSEIISTDIKCSAGDGGD